MRKVLYILAFTYPSLLFGQIDTVKIDRLFFNTNKIESLVLVRSKNALNEYEYDVLHGKKLRKRKLMKMIGGVNIFEPISDDELYENCEAKSSLGYEINVQYNIGGITTRLVLTESILACEQNERLSSIVCIFNKLGN
ncbi:MAG: hypothetical protein NXI10_17700 [bacterium]|nr:hypothetical protein [bacterium]